MTETFGQSVRNGPSEDDGSAAGDDARQEPPEARGDGAQEAGGPEGPSKAVSVLFKLASAASRDRSLLTRSAMTRSCLSERCARSCTRSSSSRSIGVRCARSWGRSIISLVLSFRGWWQGAQATRRDERGGRRQRIEGPGAGVETALGPGAEAEAAQGVIAPELPRRPEPCRRILQQRVATALGRRGRVSHAGRVEARLEQRPAQPHPVPGRGVPRADGDVIPPDVVHDQAMQTGRKLHPGQGIVARTNRACLELIDEIEEQRLAQGPPRALPFPRRGRALLQPPVRDPDKLSPRGIARICPAEAQVQQILECRPRRLVALARRIGVEGPHAPVRAPDPAGDEQVELEPPGMGMGRGQERRPAGRGDAREGNLAVKPQGEIHGRAQIRRARVEGIDVDVRRREGQHEGAVFQLTGGGTDRRARERHVAHQHFRHRCPPDEPLALGRLFGNHREARVTGPVHAPAPGIGTVFRGCQEHGARPSCEASRGARTAAEAGCPSSWRSLRSMTSKHA